jgi:ACR3 family arsenite efflux pump ArsB
MNFLIVLLVFVAIAFVIGVLIRAIFFKHKNYFLIDKDFKRNNVKNFVSFSLSFVLFMLFGITYDYQFNLNNVWLPGVFTTSIGVLYFTQINTSKF